jgi:4-amino-4-deoxy-L-arabinose transferase-like glycosyltransferase
MNGRSRANSVSSPVLLAAAAAALGIALQILDGRIQVFAVVFLGIAFYGTARAVGGRPIEALERQGAPLVDKATGIAVAVSLGAQLFRFPAEPFAGTPLAMQVTFDLGFALVGLLVWQSFRAPWRLRRIRLPLLIAIYLGLGGFLLFNTPDPPIDVFIFQRDSAAALLAGHNPYTLTFPNIYGDDTPYYGPGMVAGGRVQFGFVYMPISLLMVLPGHLLGDFRISQLLAVAAAAALMGAARRGRLGFLAAALYLFYPRSFFVMSRGWTEPLVIALLALVVFCACRWRRALPFAVGLFLVSKQYLVLALPPLLLLWPASTRWRDLRGPVGKAVLIGAAVSLPLALWNFRPFWDSVAVLQLHQPFRDDALSFPAAVAHVLDLRAPSVLAFVAAGVAIAVARRRCAHTPYGFAAAMALVFFAFFAFNKQAFCNYYHFVVGTLCLAVAVWRTEPDEETAPAQAG